MPWRLAYTTNLFQAAPLKVTRESLQDGKLRAIVVNSGNANACTGKQGEGMLTMRANTAQFGLDENDVAVASTGVIGELLKMDRVSSGIAGLPARLSGGSEGAESFSQAILTTDLVKKACVTVQVNGTKVTIAGTAKGSGMIHPNMATMLGFMTTDAVIGQEALRCAQTTNLTFNMITVDGDEHQRYAVAMARRHGGACFRRSTRIGMHSRLHYVCQRWQRRSRVTERSFPPDRGSRGRC